MKAIQLVRFAAPLEAREVPVPAIGDADVLIRVAAAGICHSDAHYQAGTTYGVVLPVTPGHEVAGTVERAGPAARGVRPGDRVAVHYLATCGTCRFCTSGHAQFCPTGQMIGKHRDGGYAELVVVPASSAVRIPDAVPFSHAAVMMCSTATALHALRKGRLAPGERVAIIGAGGLGMSAVQLARILGASDVLAVDIRADKLRVAARYGATPIDASTGDVVDAVRNRTEGGVDVALELVGLPETIQLAIRSVAPTGRAVMVGLAARPAAIDIYGDVLCRETEVIGSSDHLLSELPEVLDLAARGLLDFSHVVTRTVPLEAAPVNAVLERLHAYEADVRTVIVP